MSEATMMELYYFLIYIIGGLALGLMYDIYRISRWAVRPGKIVTYIEDTILVSLGFLIFCGLIFYLNDGIVRAYSLLALVIGTMLYFLILSKLVIRIFKHVILAIKWVMITLFIKPWRYISKAALKIFRIRQK